MKNRKKIGRKSGGFILGYKDHLENYIEPFLTVQFKLSSALLLLHELELCGEN
jgi:hypothetical protein